jgi:hypothetical protein
MRCDIPWISQAPDGTYTLGNGANSPDADIYYSLDRSLPGRANLKAKLYQGPLDLQVGQIITFAAWRPNLLPSHISVKIIT